MHKQTAKCTEYEYILIIDTRRLHKVLYNNTLKKIQHNKYQPRTFYNNKIKNKTHLK